MMANLRISKRMLAMVMAVVLCVGLLPAPALAAHSDQVMDGYFVLDENGSVLETTNTATRSEDGFTLSKTAVATGENEFEITLEVQTSQTVVTNAAAVQLVIDRSNSMKWCASCGKENGCKCKAGSRLAAVKNAIAGANGFLDTLIENNSGKIYLSVVTFSTYAETEMEWTDITTAAGLKAAKDAVNGITASGGTNLEAGLMLARNRLGMKDIATCGSKHTVLLTDGAPTYYVGGNSTSTREIESAKGSGSEASKTTVDSAAEVAEEVKELSTLHTICYGVSDEELYETTITHCEHCGKTLAEHNRVKKFLRPARYYCSGTSGQQWEEGKKTTITLTVGKFLSEFVASAVKNAYNAKDTAEVNKAFSAVCASAIEGITGAGTSVTDPMGKYIVLGDVSGVKGVTAGENLLTWNLDEKTLINTQTVNNTTTYTYRISYPVTLDTAAEGFVEGQYYPTNGYTYLRVEDSKLAFHVPGVKGKLPQVSYSVEYYLQKDAAAGDYAAYSKEAQDGPYIVKAWETVNVPAGYEAKFYGYTFAEGQTSLQVVPNGENVMKLYYNRISADVTVNHFYRTDVIDANGQVTEGAYPEEAQRTEQYAMYVGEEYTAVPANTYNEESYVLTGITPSQTIEVAEGQNVINLYYVRYEEAEEEIPEESIPEESIPEESIPEESIPEESIPE
ncbi:MAG: VWA domain-containing protein, partial [Oscillospiraceae bacterium]|nr:VWA domain-containing protein [Oscillospiraceae bacterium]